MPHRYSFVETKFTALGRLASLQNLDSISNVLCPFAALKPENIAMTMRSFIPMGITAMIENFIGNVNLAAEGPHLLQVTNYL